MSLPDLDAEMGYWTELLGVTPANGWRVSWGWLDRIPHPDAQKVEAVGLNIVDGAAKTASIAIRVPRSAAELADFSDTVAHEVMHCIGARMQALLDAGHEVDAHEYLAETMAPAMVRIKGSPRAKALAKAVRQLPARAKGTRMDVKAILAMLAMVMAASTPEEKEKLLGELKAQLEANVGEAPVSEPAPPLAADPPKPPPEKQAGADDGTSMGMSEEDRMAKDPMYKKAVTAAFATAVDTILDGRPDLTPEQKAFAKDLGAPTKVQAYLKTVGRVDQRPEGERLGLPAAPRGGNGDGSKVAPSGDKTTMRLFRVMGGAKAIDLGDSGVTLHDSKADGKLVSFSVVDAFSVIQASTEANTAAAKARMKRGVA